jgi:hypothetical protein
MFRRLFGFGRSVRDVHLHNRGAASRRRLVLESLEERRLLSIDLVSLGLSGAAGNNESRSASISGDGRYVAFESLASDLVPGDTIGTDVFVRDLVSGTTVRVSTDSNGNQANNPSSAPSINADGR